MTFSKIPQELQIRFSHPDIQKGTLNLSSYPLYSLSLDAFKDFIDGLQKISNIKEVDLTKCSLDKLKPHQLTELIMSFKTLINIKLDYNNLSADEQKLNIIYEALITLPQLHFFSIRDVTLQRQLIPSSLIRLPALRVYREEKESTTLSFLNHSEVNMLFHFLKKNEQEIKNYFNTALPPYKSLEQKPLEGAKSFNFNKLYTYRITSKITPFSFTAQTLAALHLLDSLQSTGTKMRYCTVKKIYILDLQNTNAASCERIIHILLKKLPIDLKWQLVLPEALNHFTAEAVAELEKKYPNNLSIIKTGTTKTITDIDKTHPDYVDLKSLSRHFSLYDNEFYAALEDKKKLNQISKFLKRLIEGNNAALKLIAKEFFNAHLLCSKGEHPSNEQTILALLSSDNKVVSKFLEKPCKELDEPLQSDSNRAIARITLHARAWLGRIAFYNINKNSEEGIYWYGRFLYEFPSDAQEERPNVERGLYWIRLGATHYRTPNAQSYLTKIIREENEPQHPADKYHLILASEELGISKQHAQVFKPYNNFSTLFPSRNFGDIMSDNLLGLCNYFFCSQFKTGHFSGQHKQYFEYLMRDNLLSPKDKFELVKYLYNTLDTHSSTLKVKLKETQKELMLYHEAPLGLELKTRLIPLLKSTKKYDPNIKLDNTKPMSQQPESLRRTIFCSFFEKNLGEYITHRKLFGTEIVSHENPSYIAALIHELLMQSLKYFELNGTKLAQDLDQAMQSIKNDLQEYFIRKKLVTQPASLGFRKAMTQRLVSYSTTAYVANTTELSLLRRFGETHGSEKKSQANSVMHRILYGTAFAFEALHIAVPIVLASTGMGVPAAAGSSVIIRGLLATLHKIHHYAEKTEHLMELNKGAMDLVTGLAHAHHLAHEAGFIPHGHHATPARLVDIDTIKHLNDLLLNASVGDIDNISTLIKHWAAVYQPITEELTETSNTILGILLVELLLRGLTLRLLAERGTFGKKAEMPNSIPRLLNYFNETLWLYSCPNGNDDAQLMTKEMKTLSALEVIFPRQLKAFYAGEIINIGIQPSNLSNDSSYFTTEPTLTRFASSYEVLHINQLRKSSFPTIPAFTLRNGGHMLLLKEDIFDVRICYQERRTLAGDVSFLSDKLELLQLRADINYCIRYLDDINTKMDLGKKARERVKCFLLHLNIVESVLINSLYKIENPLASGATTLENMPALALLNQDLSPKIAIRNFLDQLMAFFVLLDRKHNLGLTGLKYLAFAKLDDSRLKGLIKSIIEPEPIKISTTQDGFFNNNTTFPVELTDPVYVMQLLS